MRTQTYPIPTAERSNATVHHEPTGIHTSDVSKAQKYYGYARVSYRDRNEEEQVVALRTAGVPEDCIYIDTIVDLDSAETEYMNLIQSLDKGDTLVIKGLDKLGCSYDEIITQWQLLTKAKHVNLVVLDVPLLDTRIRPHEITDSFIADLVLQFLAYVALRERESIRQRQHEGIVAAQQRGVRFGRPPKPIPPQFETLLGQWKNKEISSRKAAQQLGVAQETFLRWARRREA